LYVLIVGNRVANNTLSGIYVTSSNYIDISYNIVENNLDCGVYLESSTVGYIYENTISNHGNDGIFIIDILDNCSITRNKIMGCNNGISIFWVSHSNIEWNEISNCMAAGIYLDITQFSNVTKNNISVADRGILISNSYRCTISKNEVSNTYDGILLITDCDYSLVRENKISGISNVGIYVESSDNVSILGNFINGSTMGIRLWSAIYSIIKYNTAMNGGLYNIYSEAGSNYNTIKLNNFVKHPSGDQAGDTSLLNFWGYNY
jgi:parallel beta-helix repeat protein